MAETIPLLGYRYSVAVILKHDTVFPARHQQNVFSFNDCFLSLGCVYPDIDLYNCE